MKSFMYAAIISIGICLLTSGLVLGQIPWQFKGAGLLIFAMTTYCIEQLFSKLNRE